MLIEHKRNASTAMAKTVWVGNDSYTFPDGMSDQEIAARLWQFFASSPAPTPAKPFLSRAEFAALMKETYPEYKEVPDEELVARILKKHPQYQSWIDDAHSQNTLPSVADIARHRLTQTLTIDGNASARSMRTEQVSNHATLPHDVLVALMAALFLYRFLRAWRSPRQVGSSARRSGERIGQLIRSGGWTLLGRVTLFVSMVVALGVTSYDRFVCDGCRFEEWVYRMLRWGVMIACGYALAAAIRRRHLHMVVWLVGIIAVFNPILRPHYLKADEWGLLDAVAAGVIAWAAVVEIGQANALVRPERS